MPTENSTLLPRPWVPLQEVLRWIAFSDFDGPPDANLNGELVDFIPFEDEAISKLCLGAEKDLAQALSEGLIDAAGYFSDVPLDGLSPLAGAYAWHTRTYIKYSPSRLAVPPPLWLEGHADWKAGSLKGYACEYINIVMDREKVTTVWPRKRSASADGLPKRRFNAGRPPLYDELEFLRLCVCEAGKNNLPAISAEFIARMAAVMDIVWGEDKSPGETWMKEKVGAIYELREKYKRSQK